MSKRNAVEQKTITIKSRAHEGMSNRGIHIEATLNLGSKNILKALKMRAEISASNTRCWGNVGHCGTWIEIDDQKLELDFAPSNMAEARQFVADIEKGVFFSDCKSALNAAAKDQSERDCAYEQGRDDGYFGREFNKNHPYQYEYLNGYRNGEYHAPLEQN